MWSAPIATAAIAGSVWLSWHAFTAWRWLLDPVLPALGLLVVYISWSAASFVRSELDKRRITDTFGRYLSPKVVETLAKNPGKIELGGETREMTFHFCDIRGFTTISEKFDPHGLTVFINKFLTPMTQIILEHDGTIDKYMGDCIMAFWNAPLDDADHAFKAVSAGIAMMAAMPAINRDIGARLPERAGDEGKPEVRIGIGINSGECVVGNVGSKIRFDYSALGDTVNTASRLESKCKDYGVPIVIGERTAADVAGRIALTEIDRVAVRGKSEALAVFTVT